MILEPPTSALKPTAGERIVLICRNPARRALLADFIPSPETHSAAVEALLAVVRRSPRAVVVNVEDIEGSVRDVVAALRRARPEVPVYVLVRPEDEPVGRGLVREGAADYFVIPGDVHRLPAILGHPEEKTTAEAGRPGEEKFFEAACRLADLAMRDSHTLLAEGASVILHAAGARHACVFTWNARAGRLHPPLRIGAPADAGCDTERTFAARVIRTGETLQVDLPQVQAATAPPDAGSAGPGAGGLLCVPMQESTETFGALCLRLEGQTPPKTQQAVAALARALGRLYRAALEREHYVEMALRDPESGLLKAETFHTYLDRLLARAAAHGEEVGLILLEPLPDGRLREAPTLGRVGRAIGAALAKGQQGARLEKSRYGVVLTRRPQDRPPGETADAFCRSAAMELAAVGPQVDPTLRLRTAVAVFPRDATQVDALVSVARTRLTGSA